MSNGRSSHPVKFFYRNNNNRAKSVLPCGSYCARRQSQPKRRLRRFTIICNLEWRLIGCEKEDYSYARAKELANSELHDDLKLGLMLNFSYENEFLFAFHFKSNFRINGFVIKQTLKVNSELANFTLKVDMVLNFSYENELGFS